MLADLGYFGSAWFDCPTDRNVDWLSRLRVKTRYKVVHTFYQRGEVFDGIVWLASHYADRAKYAVHLVTFWPSGTMRRYVTNVLEPNTFPISSMAEVYARRWDIEHRVQTDQATSEAAPTVVGQACGDLPADMAERLDYLASPAVAEA